MGGGAGRREEKVRSGAFHLWLCCSSLALWLLLLIFGSVALAAHLWLCGSCCSSVALWLLLLICGSAALAAHLWLCGSCSASASLALWLSCSAAYDQEVPDIQGLGVEGGAGWGGGRAE